MASVMQVAMEVMDRPWEWGKADCCTAACDVFFHLHGIDPMEPLRGQYHCHLGAFRMIRKEGGWLAMGDRLAARAGLIHVASDTAGNIGIVRDGSGALALGVSAGCGWWVAKTERGMTTLTQAMRIWSCPQ